MDRSHGPRCDSAAIHTVPGAVVDAYRNQAPSIPRSVRKPLSHAAFCASVRTTKPGGFSGATVSAIESDLANRTPKEGSFILPERNADAPTIAECPPAT